MSSSTNMSWDFFICHAGEDKNDIARPLAKALSAQGFRVWYDDFSLTLGDSLRRSIDYGLAHSKYGIVVLSPNFFAKEWPQRELDGLAALEIRSGKKILPIWHNVSYEDVAHFSPLLADKLAISTSKGLDIIVKEIIRVIQSTFEMAATPTVSAKGGGSRGIEKHLFHVGCGVGNRIALLPLPPGEGDPTGLNELIDALNKIGLSESPETRVIIRTRDMLISQDANSLNSDVVRETVEHFFDELDKLPDVVRAHVSSDAFCCFKLGELLYGLVTSIFLDEQDIKDETQQATPTLSTLMQLSALESLIEEMNLPTVVRQEIENLTDAIRSGRKSDPLMKDVNYVAQAIFAWFKARV